MSNHLPTVSKPSFEDERDTERYRLEYVVDQPSTLEEPFFEELLKRADNYLKFEEYLRKHHKNT